MLDKSKYKSTAQEFLEIYDITNDLAILKTGTASLILEVSAMNFGLLAEEEQDAVIYTYAALLNSLNYPIQIIIQSQTKDVTKYLNLLKEKENESAHSPRGERIARYREFVTNLIKERNVLDKKFFVVIPATPLELELLSTESVIPGKDTFDVTKYEKTVLVDKAQAILEPRRDHLISQFARIGLAAWQLTTQDIIRVFYTNYNPEASEGFEGTNTEEYQTAVVRASMMENLASMDQTLAANQQMQQSLDDQFGQAGVQGAASNQPQLTQVQQFDQFGMPTSTQYVEPSANEGSEQVDQADQVTQDNQPNSAQAQQLDEQLDQQFEQQASQLDQAFNDDLLNGGGGEASSPPAEPQEQVTANQPMETPVQQTQQYPQQASGDTNPVSPANSASPARSASPTNSTTPSASFQESVPDFSELKTNLSSASQPTNSPQPEPSQAQQTQPGKKSQTQPDPQQAVNNTLKEVGIFDQPKTDEKAGAETIKAPAENKTQSSPTSQANDTTNTQNDNPPPIPEIK
jgi:hypothetical protein